MREARAEKETIHMRNEETSNNAATVAEQGANVAPEQPASKKGPSKKKGAPKAKKSAKATKPAKAPAKKSASERSNKKAEVIALMKRAKGVTLAEIVEATGWQKHTVRGFVSILGSKGGEKIESSKNAAGEHSYRIAK
jgi:Protein of unknown function (DUF3489)